MHGQAVGTERPILWLGLAGFDSSERNQINQAAQQHRGPVQWRLSAFQDADAWLVKGTKVTTGDAGTIRVAPGMPTERSIKLGLQDVNRPISFSTPLPDSIEPLSSFDLSAIDTLGRTLDHVATWLRPRRVQFELGRLILSRGSALRHRVFHLLGSGRLLAVANFRTGRVGLAPDVEPGQIACAEWVSRPPSAGDLPPAFVQTTVSQLAWTYVRHTEENVLPTRYLGSPIYYRGAPKVPVQWISDSQLALMRELHAEPATLMDLRVRTGMSLEQVRLDLACLFVACAITSSPARAARWADTSSRGASSAGLDAADLMCATEASGMTTSSPSINDGLSRQFQTVPAPLIMQAGAA
ncbi:hypothetical protein ACPWT1_22515 [Ramlibacter sp. MMS24-I3-19]|uniref:hypothetical protein n=1 Tax=Ramlibacter sp. MMS24-I3-19 TaxID=3416606 RepID=UPI003D07EA1C